MNNNNYPEIDYVEGGRFSNDLNGWFYIKYYNNLGPANVYLKNGLNHSVNDHYAILIINKNNQYWHDNGEQHRITGPSVVIGKPCKCPYNCPSFYYHINGDHLSKEKWTNHPLVLKYKLNKIIET